MRKFCKYKTTYVLTRELSPTAKSFPYGHNLVSSAKANLQIDIAINKINHLPIRYI
ncbi:hypothetical protein TRIP_B200612 [uncultured Desulfatiglans sp.]|uniref:Uncharacterized protein n=1 Tax=Uncultured Desulfatiglans sp. TaxID=1748965 RepID=A0A653A488_UNCDX|nr:hypothetical protein TRIP_B200612 [uncultured Desulfatiglans sp.]